MEVTISKNGNLICRCPQDRQWQDVRVCSTCSHCNGYVNGVPKCKLEKKNKTILPKPRLRQGKGKEERDEIGNF